MKSISLGIMALLLLGEALGTGAWGDSYRCGRKLVITGDTSAEVQRICGKPLHKDRAREEVTLKGKTSTVPVERWHYRKNSRSLGRMVVFYRGRVVAIEVEGR